MNRKGEWGQNMPPRFGILDEGEGGVKRSQERVGVAQQRPNKRHRPDTETTTEQRMSERHTLPNSPEGVQEQPKIRKEPTGAKGSIPPQNPSNKNNYISFYFKRASNSNTNEKTEGLINQRSQLGESGVNKSSSWDKAETEKSINGEENREAIIQTNNSEVEIVDIENTTEEDQDREEHLVP